MEPTSDVDTARVIFGFADSLAPGSFGDADSSGDPDAPEPSVTCGSSAGWVFTGVGR